MAVGEDTPTLWAESRKRLMALGGGEVGDTVHDNAVFLLNALSNNGSDPACAAAGFSSCAAFAAAALDGAAAAFSLGGGGQVKGGATPVPMWGVGIHKALVAHQVLTGSPLSCLADREVGHGGEDFTVNVGGWKLGGREDLEQTHGASVRHVLDMRDGLVVGGGGDKNTSTTALSKWVLPGGQEGDLFSVDYDSMLSKWAGGEYVAMDRGMGTKDEIVLSPA